MNERFCDALSTAAPSLPAARNGIAQAKRENCAGAETMANGIAVRALDFDRVGG
jgi:hypothetical protein